MSEDRLLLRQDSLSVFSHGRDRVMTVSQRSSERLFTYRLTPTSAVSFGQGEGVDEGLRARGNAKAGEDGHYVSTVLSFLSEKVLTLGDECLVMALLELNHAVAVVRHGKGQALLLGLLSATEGEGPRVSLVVPLLKTTKCTLDGDGGLVLIDDDNRVQHRFHPASVIGFWSVVQTVISLIDNAEEHAGSWSWLSAYLGMVRSAENPWTVRSKARHRTLSIDVSLVRMRRSASIVLADAGDAALKARIRVALKEYLSATDLDTVTGKQVRQYLEQTIQVNLKDYKGFVDEQMLLIMGQMEPASMIMDQLFLGTEWNASNLDELRANCCRHIVNVTAEINSFFEDQFRYLRVSVADVPDADVLAHFDNTHRFIQDARKEGSAVLVHCQMGVSRSASVVIAFVMKEQHMSLNDAFAFVKQRRPVVKPNEGFWRQLTVYEGILRASNMRAAFSQAAAFALSDKMFRRFLASISLEYMDYAVYITPRFTDVQALAAASLQDLQACSIPPGAARAILQHAKASTECKKPS